VVVAWVRDAGRDDARGAAMTLAKAIAATPPQPTARAVAAVWSCAAEGG
jgi:hypothetical protein